MRSGAAANTLRPEPFPKADRVPPGIESRGPTLAVVPPRLVPETVRHEMISRVAYARARERGFQPGGEIEDWFAAEREVDEIIRRRYSY